jgi:aldehyde dehydrogenase (NAD+)
VAKTEEKLKANGEVARLRKLADQVVKPGKILIGGKFVDAVSGKTFETINPATKAKITDIAEGDKADVDIAVANSRETFESASWQGFSARQRGRLLLKLAELVDQNADELALLETLDVGKPIADSRAADIPLAIDVLQYYAGWADKIFGETVPVEGDFLTYTLREPVGVVAGITPWNFPMLLACWKIAPAIATGCTIIVKPAEQTPLSTIRLGELILEAGIPEGVVNIVPGFGPTAGAALSRHMDVDKVAFTGSTEVGKLIMQASGQTNLKRVSLELGGKSPQVVFADADLDEATLGVADGVFMNQGEICHAGSRVFAEKKIHDDLVGRVVEYSKTKKAGDTLDPDSTLGALVSEEQFEKVLGYIDSGQKDGAKVEIGGGKAKVAGSDGYFVEPTVFTNVKNTMKIAREEIFGPVISVIPFTDPEDCLRQANDTTYGLAAGVWTKDIKKAHRTARALRAGTVWLNTYNAFDMGSSWGGFKQSGIGRELGKHALDLYTELKTVWVQL